MSDITTYSPAEDMILPTSETVDTDIIRIDLGVVWEDSVTSEDCIELAATEDGVFLVTEDDTPDDMEDAYVDMESYHIYTTNNTGITVLPSPTCCRNQ